MIELLITMNLDGARDRLTKQIMVSLLYIQIHIITFATQSQEKGPAPSQVTILTIDL